MKRHRWQLLALLLTLVLAVFAAGCGGDDEETGGAGTTAAGEETTAESVSGTVSVMAVWTGPEQASFQAVLDGVPGGEPGRDRQLHLGRRPAADRSSRPRSRAATRPTSRCCRSRA